MIEKQKATKTFDDESLTYCLVRFPPPQGPTLLLIRDTNGQILAATVDTEWHEGHKMWGGANIRLVHLTKNFAISHRRW